MKKLHYIILSLCLVAVVGTSCSDFLERKSDSILSDDEVFSDEAMIKSVLAGFYGQIDWGPIFGNYKDFGQIDEACYSEVDNSINYSTTLWRVYPYELIRNLNIFLQSVRSTTVLASKDKLKYEGEVRFLRAWAYFNMVRGLGGMPIVGDKVFSMYDDVADMQLPRSSEAAMYDYIISECDFVAEKLSDNPSENINAARANKWVALTLKARAAIYAASIAKYNNIVTPQIVTDGGEVGIPAEKAQYYYEIARDAAKEIIISKKYDLYKKENDKSYNFYKAISSKSGNPEVIWAHDYKYPNACHSFSAWTCPQILAFGSSANLVTPLLNLVESYEYIDNRDGHLKIANANGNPIFYDTPSDLFANKDPRLKGTILCPGDVFANTEIEYQAGQMYYQSNKWKFKTGGAGTPDIDGDVVTSVNGPQNATGMYSNKTGFNFRKYLDESSEGRNPSHGSETWFIRFRYAEVLLIEAEALLELNKPEEGIEYINDVRRRAGLHDLESYTILDIEQERRVEFPLENHRYWDLKRWRRAHIIWNGVSEYSRHYTLFPYRVKDPRRPENNKWAFYRNTSPVMNQARIFELRNYYNFLDQGWLTNNPKLVKNPYQ